MFPIVVNYRTEVTRYFQSSLKLVMSIKNLCFQIQMKFFYRSFVSLEFVGKDGMYVFVRVVKVLCAGIRIHFLE
jgi:hypothetical protein